MGLICPNVLFLDVLTTPVCIAETGRAISEQAADGSKIITPSTHYFKRSGNSGSIIDGLKLTGYFLTKKVFNELSVNSPVLERQRFVDLLTHKVSSGIL